MRRNFSAANAFLLTDERGYSDDPHDSGNWWGGKLIGSNMGVTPAVLAQFLPQTPVTAEVMRNLSPSVQALIAQKLYWQPVSGDRLPDGIDFMAFDFGYNAGPGTSCQATYKALGLAPEAAFGLDFFAQVARPNVNRVLDGLTRASIGLFQGLVGLPTDTIAGPNTRSAARTSAWAARVLLLVSLREKQEQRYQSLGNSLYLKGWLNRTEQRFRAALDLPSVKGLK